MTDINQKQIQAHDFGQADKEIGRVNPVCERTTPITYKTSRHTYIHTHTNVFFMFL